MTTYIFPKEAKTICPFLIHPTYITDKEKQTSRDIIIDSDECHNCSMFKERIPNTSRNEIMINCECNNFGIWKPKGK